MNHDDKVVVETASRLWHYHLASVNEPLKALCDSSIIVMHSRMPLRDWNKPFNEDRVGMKPTFCAKCETKRNA